MADEVHFSFRNDDVNTRNDDKTATKAPITHFPRYGCSAKSSKSICSGPLLLLTGLLLFSVMQSNR